MRRMDRWIYGWVIGLWSVGLFGAVPAGGPKSMLAFAPPPIRPAGLEHGEPFFPPTTFRTNVPSPKQILGFAVGERAATPEQIVACLQAWAKAAPDRCRLVHYADSYEGRPLYLMIVSAPENIRRLEQIRKEVALVVDPRETTDSQAKQKIQHLPAPVWLAYTIHGDETEGSDAALAVLYWLIAGESQKVETILKNLIVIVDPLMNPDGRARFLKMVAEARSCTPNVDDQSLLHRGYWPRGRGNHYLFDLNRDWILCVHQETRGRVKQVVQWNPVLFVDAHGMGPQATHLFSPPREPINPNIPKGRHRWGEIFAKDQARAFDRAGLLYYNGEWHEEWYPGYSDAYASYRGAIGILYEQARIAEDGVRRPEGRILTYHDSVRHHVIGNLANLETAARHAKELLWNVRQTRKDALDPKGPYGKRIFAFDPAVHPERVARLIELLQLHGIEVYRADKPFVVDAAIDLLGRRRSGWKVPAGTILVPNRQPLGHLVAAALEFDTRFTKKVLQEERRSILLEGHSRIYDVTSWSLPMLFGLRAWTLKGTMPSQVHKVQPQEVLTLKQVPKVRATHPVGWIVDGRDDRSVVLAARLMERGVAVRLAVKPLKLDGRRYARGSIVVTRLDNQTFQGNLSKVLQKTAREVGLQFTPLRSGTGPGDWPDLGGGYFRLLRRPRIALVGRDAVSAYDYGAVWYLMDHVLAIPHTHLTERLAGDLNRYNVLIVPGGRGIEISEAVKNWVRNGGTLILMGGAVDRALGKSGAISRVKQAREVLSNLKPYRIALIQEWLGEQRVLPPLDAIWSHTLQDSFPPAWKILPAKSDEQNLRDRIEWAQRFMPHGAFVAARCNTNHWLTVGCDSWIPILVTGGRILVADRSVEVPVRYGIVKWSPRKALASTGNEKTASSKKAKSEEKKRQNSQQEEKALGSTLLFQPVGWSVLPKGGVMYLRLSGLIWPEAREWLANAAWCTRERIGKGQLILFATSPVFRGTALPTIRIFLNAVVYGPGCGTYHPIQP